MIRLAFGALAVVLAIGGAIANAQTNDSSRSRLLTTSGVVKAVTASSLTLERDGAKVTFGVAPSTRVIGQGTAGSDLVLRQPPKGVRDLVTAGDLVTVRYRRSGRALHAVEVRVRTRSSS